MLAKTTTLLASTDYVVWNCTGVDQGEQCAGHCVQGQPSPVPIRGEAGPIGSLLHQGEGS